MMPKISKIELDLKTDFFLINVGVDNYDAKLYKIKLTYGSKDINSIYLTKFKIIKSSTISYLQFKNNDTFFIKASVYELKTQECKAVVKREFQATFTESNGKFHIKPISEKQNTVITNSFKTKEEVKKLNAITKPITKIHFTIGMFFDGTCNNRFNSEKQYYKNITNENKYYKSIANEFEVKTESGKKVKIASDSSFYNPYSNVALLHDLYEEKAIDTENKITLRHYVQGIGTKRDEDDDIFGAAFGEGERGIVGKVIEGCNDVVDKIIKVLGTENEIGSLTFDVFGFSRGAASARHFCNQILDEDAIKTVSVSDKGKNINPKLNNYTNVVNDNIVITPNKQILKPKKTAQLFVLGIFGKALKKKGIKLQSPYQYSYEKKDTSVFVKVRFLGLFDTVVSQMIVKNHFGKNLPIFNHITSSIEEALDIVKQDLNKLKIDYIFQISAKNEHRKNFALTKIGNKGFEFPMIGVHSDIGGGYAATTEEKNILDYDNEFVLTPNPERLNKLKQLYIINGYCKPNEITIEPIKLGNTKLGEAIGLPPYLILYNLISTRKVIPRYSVIPMYVMKNIATSIGVPLNLKEDEQKFKFEYYIPKKTEKYLKQMLYLSEKGFKEKYQIKTKIKSEKVEKIDKLTESYIKNKLLHLSSNYNSSLILNLKGEDAVGLDNLDEIVYSAVPNYNSNKTNYEREIFTNRQ